jgi:hypothetical protein
LRANAMRVSAVNIWTPRMQSPRDFAIIELGLKKSPREKCAGFLFFETK